MDYYSKAKRAEYNKKYREKHRAHLAFCSQLYKGGGEVSLRARVEELSEIHGGIRKLAKKLRIEVKDLSDCLNGQRPVVPDRQIFRKLGLRVVLSFERL